MLNKLKRVIMGDNKRLIRVSFIDNKSGDLFATSDMPIEQLPKSFEAETTMYISNEAWKAVKAEPITSEEFAVTKQLSLYLDKINVEKINASEILYSIPTINDEIPEIAVNSSKLDKNVFEIHEDAWRQVEVIPDERQDIVDINFGEIAKIYEGQSKDVDDLIAFKEIYVRKGFNNPLKERGIPLESVKQLFGDNIWFYEGLAYVGVAGIIEKGFAFKTESSMVVYGCVENSMVTTLCINTETVQNDFEDDVASLYSLLSEYDLCLVDWCKMAKVTADTEEVYQYFRNFLE